MIQAGKPRKDPIRTLGEAMLAADGVLLYPHIHADGDAVGSSAALCRMLRLMGKDSHIVLEDEVAENLLFLLDDMGIDVEQAEAKISDYDDSLAIAIDGGEYSRFPKREEVFRKADNTMCIDHHHTSEPIFDYNYIEDASAATAELIYEIIEEMNWQADEKVYEAILAGIMTDTGNFVYSNTSSRSHLIAAKILQKGIDQEKLGVNLYQCKPEAQVKLHAKAILAVEFIGPTEEVGLSTVTMKMLQEIEATDNDVSGLVEKIRDIDRCKVSVVIHQVDDEEYKISFRSCCDIDVSKLAQAVGRGGGHVKAAGTTFVGEYEELRKKLDEEISKIF